MSREPRRPSPAPRGARPRADLAAVIAANVRRLRTRWGWSFDALAERSGVSRGMLLKIEQGTVNPSVGTLVHIADAMGTNVAGLVEEGERPRVRVTAAGAHPVLWRGKRGSTAALLGGSDGPGHLESWAWRLAPRDRYTSDAHPPGTEEFLSVLGGTLTLAVAEERFSVPAGGSVVFDAGHPHGYFNDDRKQPLTMLMFVATPGR